LALIAQTDGVDSLAEEEVVVEAERERNGIMNEEKG
jgi:hypothetical protein